MICPFCRSPASFEKLDTVDKEKELFKVNCSNSICNAKNEFNIWYRTVHKHFLTRIIDYIKRIFKITE